MIGPGIRGQYRIQFPVLRRQPAYANDFRSPYHLCSKGCSVGCTISRPRAGSCHQWKRRPQIQFDFTRDFRILIKRIGNEHDQIVLLLISSRGIIGDGTRLIRGSFCRLPTPLHRRLSDTIFYTVSGNGPFGFIAPFKIEAIGAMPDGKFDRRFILNAVVNSLSQ